MKKVHFAFWSLYFKFPKTTENLSFKCDDQASCAPEIPVLLCREANVSGHAPSLLIGKV